MRDRPWTLWTLALLVAVAATTKAAHPDAFAADLSGLLADAGVGPWFPGPHLVVWSVVAFELTVAAAIVVRRTSRAGLLLFLVLLGMGTVLVGRASDWGGRVTAVCPCGLPAFLTPFVHSGFAALLLRNACLVTLVAMSWNARAERRALPEEARV